MEELFGSGTKVINNKFEEMSVEEILKTRIICLLFTATWCSPCTIFEKELMELYNEANLGEKVFEVIHISFDKSEDVFKKSILNKPWLFIPFNDSKKKEFADKFQVISIPMFLVLKPDGSVLTENGRKQISEEGLRVIDIWLQDLQSIVAK